MMKHLRLSMVLALVAISASVSECFAEVKAFVVNPELSSLTVTSTTTSAFGGSAASTEQDTGSLTTKYSGLIFADLTGSSIQLLSPTKLIAAVNGNWKPGTDYSQYPGDNDDPNGYKNTALPANYGLVTDISFLPIGVSNSAVRDLEIGLVDAAPKTIVGGEFDEALTATDFLGGTVYYDAGGYPPTTDLVNDVSPTPTTDMPGTGTLVESGNVKTLTIPVSFSVTYNIAVLVVTTHYSGTIVASVPEPSSVLLCAVVGACLFGTGARRRR